MMANTVVAFPILTCMSLSYPPYLLILLPRYTKSSTSSISSPSRSILSAFLVLTLITFVLDLLIIRPVCIESFARLVSLDWMVWWLCERRRCRRRRPDLLAWLRGSTVRHPDVYPLSSILSSRWQVGTKRATSSNPGALRWASQTVMKEFRCGWLYRCPSRRSSV